MKAERRHELQTNELALWLRWRAPQLLQQYGNKILLALIVVMAAIFIVRWRVNAARTAEQRVHTSLARAEQEVDMLRSGRPSPDAANVPELVRMALAEAEKPEAQALAYSILGDYYWTLGTMVNPASTQPVDPGRMPPDEALTRAQEAFSKVLTLNGASPLSIANAHLGLGVIAETRARAEDEKGGLAKAGASPLWATAKEHFQAVVNDDKLPSSHKSLAEWHLTHLARLQEPVWLVDAAPLPPATMPLGPYLPPSTQSTTRPAAPSTRPAAPTTNPAK